MTEYPLTKANRLRLAEAFRHHQRVDLCIDCVIEDQMGLALVDSPDEPTAFKIEVGPFCYFAGDAAGPGGREMVERVAPYAPLMPSPEPWIELAKEIHGDKLDSSERFSFTAENLSLDHIRSLLGDLPFAAEIEPIDVATAEQLNNDSESFADLSLFDSAEDFADRGIGYSLREGTTIIGVAYSSLVCSRGVEGSIFVRPEYRRRGIATGLACKLVEQSLLRGLEPHYDAANLESCRLAEKLGYVPTGSYREYFVRP